MAIIETIKSWFGKNKPTPLEDKKPVVTAPPKTAAPIITINEQDVANSQSHESLLDILNNAQASFSVKELAIKRIEDQELLAQLASQHSIAKIRQQAAEKLVDLTLIEKTAQALKQSDKGVYRILRQKLDNHEQQQKQLQEKQQRIDKICSDLNNLLNSAHNPLFNAKVQSLAQQWQQLNQEFAIDVTSQQRFDQAYQQAQQLVQQHQAQSAKEQQAQLMQQQLSEQFTSLSQSISTTEQLDELLSINQQLNQLRQQWQATIVIVSPNNELQNSVQTDEGKLNQISRQLDKLSSQIPEIIQLSQQLLDNPIQQGTYQHLQKRLKNANLNDAIWQIPILASVPQALKLAEQALKAQKQAQQKAQTEQAINTPTKAKVDHELDSLIQKIGELIANGQHKEAEPLLRQAQQYAKNHKLFDARLGDFIEEMQKMRDWAGFAIIPKKQDLLQQMQHLAQQATEANLDALNHLDKIKALQAEWQGLGIANNEQEKNLWQQFKEVSQQAYAPCQQFFDQQNAIQAENAAQRQALCQELKHYLDNLPEQVNWQGHIAILKKAREDWQKYHPVEAKLHKKLQAEFTQIIKALEDKLHAEYQLQEDKKRGLIAKAENLLNHENIFEACHQAKDLQNTWKTLGSCGHNKDQQLWEEFRQHCDALFAKRHEAKAAKQAEDAQVVAQAEELLKQLHTLLNTPEHTPTSEQVEPLLQQLDSQYFPKEANHELRKQINQCRRQWQDYLAKQVNSEKQASLKQLSQTLDLCLAAENVVLAGQPVSVEMVLQWQENVAQIHHYFKNALQKRWQNLSTLANDETEQQLREEKAQDACLLLELLLAIDSPASEKAARIAKKMALFEQQSYPKTSQDAQVLIITTLNQILLIGGLNPERSQSLKQRLDAILMSAALSRML